MTGGQPTGKSHLRLDFLDSLRGVAILLVCFYHVLGSGFGHDQLPWGRWTRVLTHDLSFDALTPLMLGWFGVPMFFAVSGFCIHLSHAAGNKTFAQFFIRRFFRIYPPYLLALLLFMLTIESNRESLKNGEGIGQLVSHLFLVQNFADRWFFGINFSFWSIAIEAQLYAIYPVLLWITGLGGWTKTLSLLAVVEIGIRLSAGLHESIGGTSWPRAVTDNPLAYWFSWSIGAYAAELLRSERLGTLARLPVSPFVFCAVISHFVRPLSGLCFTAIAFATAIWICRKARAQTGQGRVSFHLLGLRRIGEWSYSLYLFHQPVILTAAFRATRFLPVAWDDRWVRFGGALVMLVALAPLCALSYRHVEVPCAGLGRRLAAKVGGRLERV
jgi:hypothetical protein